MHAHVPQIFPITNRALKPTLPSRVPSRPLVPLSPPSYPLSLCLFSFLPLLPSPFSIATLRNVFYAPARSYTHAYNVPTPRTVAQELLDRRVLFPLSLLPVPATPFLLSSFLALARSLLPVPPPPFLYLSNGPRFQRGPARVSGPPDLFSRSPVQV